MSKIVDEIKQEGRLEVLTELVKDLLNKGFTNEEIKNLSPISKEEMIIRAQQEALQSS